MRKLLRSMIVAGASVLMTAGVASASLVIDSWDETNPGALAAGSIGHRNDVLGALGVSSLEGYHGAQISLTTRARLTYTFLGFEANKANHFVADGRFDTEIFAGNKAVDLAGLVSFTRNADAGLLDFRFLTNGGRGGVANGGPNSGLLGQDFFASIVGSPTARSGRSLLLFLDDLGPGSDDDYDDLVLRIDVAAMPLPASALLVGTAFLGLGLLRRRKS